MRTISAAVAVPNAILLINDVGRPPIPEITRDARLWSNRSCVVVGCTPACDGDTTITIGAAQDVDIDTLPVFDGVLETPTRTVLVEIVPGITILRKQVSQSTTRIRVWTNHPREPDIVIIGLE